MQTKHAFTQQIYCGQGIVDVDVIGITPFTFMYPPINVPL